MVGLIGSQQKPALGGLEKAQALRSVLMASNCSQAKRLTYGTSDATPQLLYLSVILTKRPRTTRRHAGFTTIWVDGRRLLAGVCNGHTIVEKIIHTVA